MTIDYNILKSINDTRSKVSIKINNLIPHQNALHNFFYVL